MKATKFANLVLIAIIVYLGLLLFEVAIRGAPFFYPMITATLTFCAIGLLKLPEVLRVNLVVALVSTGLTILAIESVSALTDSPGDTRTKIEVLTALRESGADAYPNLHPYLFVPNGLKINGDHVFPLGGVANKITVYCNETGSWLIYESDKHGFHNPKGIWDSGPIDVVAIGDSLTQGACVESEENAVALIRDVHGRTLNLGIGGTGPLFRLAILKEYVGELKPNVVLWFYAEANDLKDLTKERLYPFIKDYLESDFHQNLRMQQRDIDDRLAWRLRREMQEMETSEEASQSPPRITLLRPLRFPKIGALIKISIDRPLDKMYEGNKAIVPRLEKVLPLNGRVMRDARDYVASWGGELYFVYLPTHKRYRVPRLAQEDVWFHDAVISTARALNIPVIDLTESFDAHPEPLSLWRTPIYGRWGHYNKDGYRLVAETVLRSIQLEND